MYPFRLMPIITGPKRIVNNLVTCPLIHSYSGFPPYSGRVDYTALPLNFREAMKVPNNADNIRKIYHKLNKDELFKNNYALEDFRRQNYPGLHDSNIDVFSVLELSRLKGKLTRNTYMDEICNDPKTDTHIRTEFSAILYKQKSELQQGIEQLSSSLQKDKLEKLDTNSQGSKKPCLR